MSTGSAETSYPIPDQQILETELESGEESKDGETLAELQHQITSDPEMQLRAKQLFENIQAVNARINAAKSGAGIHRRGGSNLFLIAVSKLKPASDILALHTQGQTHFGENYAQELDKKHAILPSAISWHYIGGLQTNACPKLARIPNLHSVHSVDSLKKASQLNKHRPANLPAIHVYIQLNTSGESSKSGLTPSSPELIELAKNILKECPKLKLAGLMTIGALARSKAAEFENEDFTTLVKEADDLEKEMKLEAGSLGLSMGMSEDFEVAIGMGATCVRVGSSIFGQRPKKEDAVI